jgi:hypothetical protein
MSSPRVGIGLAQRQRFNGIEGWRMTRPETVFREYPLRWGLALPEMSTVKIDSSEAQHPGCCRLENGDCGTMRDWLEPISATTASLRQCQIWGFRGIEGD